MAAKKIDLGGTGETVKENVKRLRGGMQYKELSERLSKVGRPIPPLGLRRIEAGERRVDVDDLMALAVVFDVSPLALLLPENGSRDLARMMTGVPDREVSHNTQWLFGLGRSPLTVDLFGSQEQRELKFQLRSVPTVDERKYAGGVLIDTIQLAQQKGDPKILEDATNESNALFYRSAQIQGLIDLPEDDDGND